MVSSLSGSASDSTISTAASVPATTGQLAFSSSRVGFSIAGRDITYARRAGELRLNGMDRDGAADAPIMAAIMGYTG